MYKKIYLKLNKSLKDLQQEVLKQFLELKTMISTDQKIECQLPPTCRSGGL